MSDLQARAERLAHWLYQDALPLWADVGVDRARGGFFECLTLDGRPAEDLDKRMRVQARQVYVYSHAAVLGWDGPAYEVARAGVRFLTEHYWHGEGGWIFSATPDGRAAAPRREAYEQAFALLAFAWYHRAFGADDAMAWVARTMAFLDERLADAVHGGYREALPDQLPRRQNPHMHLLEAFLSLYEATEDGAWLERARLLVGLFQDHFFDAETGTLREFFTESWAPAPGIDGRRLEPGHHFEWVWLLQRYQDLSGDDNVTEPARALYRFAEAQGTDSSDGMAYDEVLSGDGASRDSKRLWPQTEALKAQLVAFERWNDGRALDRAGRTIDAMFERYLCLEPGLWLDQIHRDGRPMGKYVTAGIFYHLFLAFSEYLRVAATR